MYRLDAACLTDIGKVRQNNEDNLLFHGRILSEIHTSMAAPITHKGILFQTKAFAVFDGIGGEANGESASYYAALQAKNAFRTAPLKQGPFEDFLIQACSSMNRAVVDRAAELRCVHMGTTLAALCFHRQHAYACNLGDSKIFLLRSGQLTQLSEDHTDSPELWNRSISRKPGLTQYLGIDPEELLIEPSITSVKLQAEDVFLVCSDGLSDMVCPEELALCLDSGDSAALCVNSLVQAALKNGGRDNITAIVCKIGPTLFGE